jgi:hypothetical protein
VQSGHTIRVERDGIGTLSIIRCNLACHREPRAGSFIRTATATGRYKTICYPAKINPINNMFQTFNLQTKKGPASASTVQMPCPLADPVAHL